MNESVILGVDHIYVPLRDAERAYAMLTETLGLPVAWPYQAHGDFASGGVNLGNLNLEVLRHIDAAPAFAAHSPARLQGIALHPVSTDRLIAELDRRHIPHSPPQSFRPGTAPDTGAMWTNVRLEDLCGPEKTVFTCEYHLPGVHNYEARQSSLDDRGGGLLGVTGVRDRDQLSAASRGCDAVATPPRPTPTGRSRLLAPRARARTSGRHRRGRHRGTDRRDGPVPVKGRTRSVHG